MTDAHADPDPDDRALWLDGNAIAGLLTELFGGEPTAAPRRCPSCRARHAIAEHRVYLGAGVVLRCPSCGDLALRVVEAADGRIVHLTGTWTLQTSARGG